MTRARLIALLCLLLVAPAAVSGPPTRIVSLAPHITELLHVVGAGERIVGAVEWSDHPPEAREILRVGDAFRVDLERLMALDPDLVISWRSGNPAALRERLARLGMEVLTLEPESLADIAAHLELLGEMTGNMPQGRQAAEEFREAVEALRGRYADRPSVRVFYQVDARPLYTLGGSHNVNEAIELCGGTNVFAGLSGPAPTVSLEAVIEADPEAIVATRAEGSEADPLSAWARWPGVTAVRYGNLFTLPPDHISRASPRMLKGIGQLCEHLETARERLGKDQAGDAQSHADQG
jgi:iron complex transport system substrate-binding protein